MSYEFRGNTYAKGEPKPRRAAAARSPRTARDRSLSQVLALAFGLTFLLGGILGFIPGITSNYDELSLLGTDSHAELLGLFRVSILHNVVHMLFGVGILAAARGSWSRLYLLGGAAAYAVVAAYGIVVEESSGANFLPVNHAGNLLHVALTAGLLAAGVAALAAERKAGP